MRCLAALLLLVAPLSFAGARVTVELLPQARVAGDTVVLGDVAMLHSEDLSLMRRLVRIPLGRAPHAGEISMLQRDELGTWMRRQAAVTADQIAWTGATESRVFRVMPVVHGEEIARIAVDAVRAVLESRGQSARVQVRIAPRDVDLPGPTWRIEVRGLETGLGRQRPLLWADIWSGDVFVRTMPVALEVAMAPADAAMAAPTESAQPLRRIDPERGAAADQAPPVVARGDWATLRSAAGPILVEGRVEVLQDGRPGQKIRVRQQGAAGILFARVVGRGQLELAP
jgi:flagella basal body P-ring formation protein FlgA